MGKKAKNHPTPELPPLDDIVRWLGLDVAAYRLIERLLDGDAAVIDLYDAGVLGRLHYMHRSGSTGERRHLDPAELATLDMFWQPGRNPSVSVRYRDRSKHFFGSLHVWSPEFEAICSPADVPVDPDDIRHSPSALVKPGPKFRDDWPTLVAAWLIGVVTDDPKRLRNVDQLVVEATIFLESKIDWAPEDKRVRATIRELLQFVPR